jgi:hypothetical protein
MYPQSGSDELKARNRRMSSMQIEERGRGVPHHLLKRALLTFVGVVLKIEATAN